MQKTTAVIIVLFAIAATPMLRAQEPQPDQETNRRPSLAQEAAGAAVGAVSTSLAFAYLGAATATSGGEDPGLVEAILGAMAGSVLGSAVGVSIAGNSTGDTGNFGSALAGSGAGFLLFFLMTPSLDSDYAPFFIGLWGLPAAGALLGYTTSRDRPSEHTLKLPLGRATIGVAPTKGGIGVQARFGF